MLARLSLLTLFAFVAGCQESGPPGLDPDMVGKLRNERTLAEEPEGALTPLDLREQEGGFEAGRVVLVGQVGGLPNPWEESQPDFPWKAGEATFFLVDPATAADFADHAPDDPDHHENCPFCARALEKSGDAIAAVTFADAEGKPLAVGARELFGLEEHDVVVVRGDATLAGGVLLVQADGVYVRE